MILAIEVMVMFFRISHHLIRSFEERFIFNLLQNLMHWLSKHGVDCLKACWPWLSHKIPSWSIVIVTIRPVIPPFLRDNLILPLPMLLILFDLFILVNPIHQPTHTGDRFASKRLPQTVISGESELESTDGQFNKITINLVKHLPVHFRVRFQTLPLLHA